jgi:phosphopantothenoylcysteine decarboxylase/phosphopantothenate--cysteine ligase
VHPVVSTADMARVVGERASSADLVVMAAAPADFTPTNRSDTKIKKSGDGGLHLDLVQTTDVLATLVRERSDPRQVLIGFAAETPTPDSSLLELGRAKLLRKGCDVLVLNEVGEHKAFGRPDNEIVLLTAAGADGPYAGSKDFLAHLIWDTGLRQRSHR